MPSSAEARVKILAKLKSNTKCPNCGAEKKFGFSTVCIKFFTFVCNECKTSHQAISHRCKSLTMSSWTDDEVAALERNGNVMARRTWLKNAPPEGQGGRPAPGMDINVYKRFVVEAYEHRRYYGELDPNDGMGDPGHAGGASAPTTSRQQGGGVPSSAAAARVRKPSRHNVVPAPAPVAPPAPAPVADLLDFGSAAAPTTTTSAPVSGNVDLFSADFSSFSAPAPGAISEPASTTTVNGFDAFAAAPAVQTPALSAPVGRAADPFAFGAFGSGVNGNNTNGNKAAKPVTISVAADPFVFGSFESSLPAGGGPSSSSTLASTNGKKSNRGGGNKKPIMGGPGASGSSNANAISMMGGVGAPNKSNNISVGGMSMMNNNNKNNSNNPMMMMNMNNNMNMMAANMKMMNANMNMMMNPQMMAMMQQQQQQMMGGGGMGMSMPPNPQMNMNMNNGTTMMGSAPNMTMGGMSMTGNNQNMMGMMNNQGMMMNADQQRAFQQMMMNQSKKR